MGIVPRVGFRAGMRTVMLVLAAVAVALLWGPRPGNAADPGGDLKVVRGTVKSVSATGLQVGGKTYEIAGVPIRTSSRKTLSPADIAPGTIVDLYFRGGKLVLVHVRPNIVE